MNAIRILCGIHFVVLCLWLASKWMPYVCTRFSLKSLIWRIVNSKTCMWYEVQWANKEFHKHQTAFNYCSFVLQLKNDRKKIFVTKDMLYCDLNDKRRMVCCLKFVKYLRCRFSSKRRSKWQLNIIPKKTIFNQLNTDINSIP